MYFLRPSRTCSHLSFLSLRQAFKSTRSHARSFSLPPAVSKAASNPVEVQPC